MTTTNESSTSAPDDGSALPDLPEGRSPKLYDVGPFYDEDQMREYARAALAENCKERPQPDDGGPAFPVPELNWAHGMTLRQYAAIKLRVPDSGIDWLDDMIRTSMQDEFAAKAMQQIIPLCVRDSRAEGFTYEEHVAENAFAFADAMLKARG
ncbi:hypothetical protein [Burkholderia gladioli]|uniref:hypothetical protein n=2 Tax=Burkholderia gladioli TaxID=28095 RepID=UPI0016412758|nr:hypothetical protein [Burkholderia gladioli]